MSTFDQRDQSVDQQFNAGRDIVLPGSSAQSSPTPFPAERVASVRDLSLNKISDAHRDKLIYRLATIWPEFPLPAPFSVNELRDHTDAISGSRHASVWAFLRYADSARWDPARQVLGWHSKKTDDFDPLYVYWEVDRSGLIIQHSTQPLKYDQGLSIEALSYYCCQVTGIVGRFYHRATPESRICVDVRVLGIPQRHLEGSDSGAKNVIQRIDLDSSAVRSKGEWSSSVMSCAADLLEDIVAQANERLARNTIETFCEEAVARLSALGV